MAYRTIVTCKSVRTYESSRGRSGEPVILRDVQLELSLGSRFVLTCEEGFEIDFQVGKEYNLDISKVIAPRKTTDELTHDPLGQDEFSILDEPLGSQKLPRGLNWSPKCTQPINITREEAALIDAHRDVTRVRDITGQA